VFNKLTYLLTYLLTRNNGLLYTAAQCWMVHKILPSRRPWPCGAHFIVLVWRCYQFFSAFKPVLVFLSFYCLIQHTICATSMYANRCHTFRRELTFGASTSNRCVTFGVQRNIVQFLTTHKQVNKKLIRRWDSKRELSLRRYRTRTIKYNRLVHKFRRRSTRLFVRTQVYQIQWNNATQRLLRRSRSFKVTDFGTNRNLIYDLWLILT